MQMKWRVFKFQIGNRETQVEIPYFFIFSLAFYRSYIIFSRPYSQIYNRLFYNNIMSLSDLV